MKKSTKAAAIRVAVTEDERDRVKSIAKERGYSFSSDYIRALIEADAEAHGLNIKFEVDRGGYRERNATTTD